MKALSLKSNLAAFLLSLALVPLAAEPLAAQSYYVPQGGQYPYTPQPAYAQPQYQQPSYPQQYAQPQEQYPQPQEQYVDQPQGYAPQVAQQQAMSPDQLEQLVAPIALYPDGLVAQILAGATYPAQIAAADQWIHQIGAASPDQVAAAASAQTMWDPSIKALTAYPQVLDMLAGNLQWATELGNAYYNQPQDVLQTVQVLRMRAQQSGALVSTPQEEVVQNPGYIALQPVNPDVVYVPTYNPWTVYGAPIQPYPGFSFCGVLSSLANAFLGGGFGSGYGGGYGSSPISYLLSFALGAFNHTPFGLLSWGLDWLVNALTFHHSDYYTQSASVRDWGLPHGGPRAYGWHGGGYGYGHGGFGAGFRGGYNHQAISIHAGPRNTLQPRFGNPNRERPQFGFSRGGNQQWANNRGYGGVEPARQMYQQGFRSYSTMPRTDWQRSEPRTNGWANSYGRQGSVAWGGSPQNFHQPRMGGNSFFGGSCGYSYKAPKFKEPKYSYKAPKMPKYHASHESHFGGGGHSHGGGGGHHHR